MTHRDKFEFVNELRSTTNREFACAHTRTAREHYAQRALRSTYPPPVYGSCYARVYRETL